MTAETCRDLVEGLNDESLQQIVRYKLEGHTNQEIAEKLDYALRTVNRKLRLVRNLWSQEE